MKERDLSIDYAKGIAILLVYMGHSILYYPPGLFENCGWSKFLSSMIVSCNMPLFFFISGLLFAFSKKSNLQVSKDKSKRLLLPYLFTMTIVEVGKLLMPSSMAYKPVEGGVIEILMDVFLYGGDRWFVYVLMGIFLVSLPLRNIAKTNWVFAIIIVIVGVRMTVDMPRLFLFDDIVKFLPFFLVGMWINRYYEQYKRGSVQWFGGIAVIFAMMNVVFVLALKRISIMSMLILPLVGTAFFMSLAFVIERWSTKVKCQFFSIRYLAYCGRYSLQFYLFTFAYPIIRHGVVNVMHVSEPFLVFILVFLLQLIIMTGIIEVTRRIKILKIPMGY